MPHLANIDQTTGLPVRKPKPVRYEVDRPGRLVHVDIKKQGRKAGVLRDRAARAGAAGARGYRYLHHAVDDYSRVAYSEILDDERKATAAGFWNARTRSLPGSG